MKRRLRILIVPQWYPSERDPVGGIFIADQARAAALHHDVTVLVPGRPDAQPSGHQDDGVQTLALLRPGRDSGNQPLARLRQIDSAIRHLVKNDARPDVIHAHTFSAGALSVLIGLRWRLPVIVSEHHTDLIEHLVVGWNERVARFAYSRAGLVCPVSEPLARSITELEPRARCDVVENVVEVDRFAMARPHTPRTSQRLLTVAGLVRQKGLPFLLDALRELVREFPDATLDIVGDGPDRETLQSLASDLPVTFSGARTRNEVAARMHAADALVMPSLVETFGIAAVEGLAASLPVIVTDAFPVADLIAENGGIVVPTADADALRHAMAAILTDRPILGPHVSGELRARFGPDAIGARWDSVYRRVIRERDE